MSYLDKIRRCNVRDMARFVPFLIGGAAYGWVTRERADVLRAYPEVFVVSPAAVALHPSLTTPAARSAALAAVASDLARTPLFPVPLGELYAVKRRWHETEAMRLDRALVPAFGLRAYGVHVNGVVRQPSGPHLWIATRAADRIVAPGKLDNMVGGGQPAGLSLTDNVIKECAEEAGLPEAVARRARPAGAISYSFAVPAGLRVDTLFVYDLDLPADTVPINRDGEIAAFTLMPLPEVLSLVRDSDRFKFNVNLVIIDFALRHGVLDPGDEADYEAIVAGLHLAPDSVGKSS